jgi:DNA polymerase-1
MSTPVRRLFLIDAMGYIFRAYHQPQTQKFYTRAGTPTGAVFVFNNMLRKLLSAHHPDYVAAAFDTAGPTFRDELFAAYKANRAEMPSELARQIPYIRRLLGALHIPILECPGYEADDVLGALARQAAGQGLDVTIVSSDKDMLQLVRDAGEQGVGRISVLIPTKDDMVCDEPKVGELMGVPPRQVPDVMALRGDAIDNIPGAPGIGEKGSTQLIQRFGSVEAALEHAAEVERKTYRESLQNNREQILQSKQLATLVTDIPVLLDLETVTARQPDTAELTSLYSELEFHSLAQEFLPKLEETSKNYKEAGSAEEARALFEGLRDAAMVLAVEESKVQSPRSKVEASGSQVPGPASQVQAQPGLWASEAAKSAEPAFQNDQAPAARDLGPETWDPGPGLAVSAEAGEARVVPGRFLAAARGWLESPDCRKTVEDSKAAVRTLRLRGIELAGVEHDTLLYSYLLDPTLSDHTLEAAVERRFNQRLGGHPAERADLLGQLARALAPDIHAAGLEHLYREIELPLAPVLADLEEAGIRVDCGELARLSQELGPQIDALASEIYRLCGAEFNINSPQQLAKVLDDLKLGGLPKRGRVRSTAVGVLQELAQKHELPRRVLEYRQLFKLKSTYADTLPNLVSPRTGRVHTTFDQAGTATGRLSSREPPLQNIPIRTELGRQIRAAFIPEPGWKIIAADYSQIELRILAHVSRDPVLLDAFRRNEDIHARTAELVFGVPPLMQSKEHRRRAKAVNYGIVYGLSPFGLSQQLGIDKAEAKQFIDDYFLKYAGVRRYIDRCLEEVRKSGEVRTLYGRLRPIPEINSPNAQQRGFAERTAINTPLQGTAADLIKIAMIRIHQELRAAGMKTRMLLQVHDELVFEAPAEEVEAARQRIKRGMEAAAALAVPLIAEVSAGDNWRDAK